MSLSENNEAPACQSCRKRKLKCSRETPACSQCVRLNNSCRYDPVKQKPGIKSGVIETLSRRLEFLEKILLDSDGNQKPLRCDYHDSQSHEQEVQRQDGEDGPARLNSQQDAELVTSDPRHRNSLVDSASRKRKRDWPDHDLLQQNGSKVEEEDSLPSSLPPEDVLDLAVDAFYTIIHPWIPFIHLARFRENIDDPQKRPELEIILHAMVSATMKYLKEEDVRMTRAEMARQARLSRNAVLLTAIDGLAIQNIQALIIIAFDDIGSGQVSKAWPIIGSLTRTVDYMQLTVEPDEIQQYSLSKPILLLNKPSDWTESENRRRIFWNVFLLDRFCSVTTGWNTSLTSDDVHRRLPCDGGLWQHREEAAVTPYFGIWNRSAAKIGNSVAFIPAHYPSPDHNVDPRSPNAGPGPVDTSKLGAFAYCIEATESLSQVTTFFLQQKVDFRNRQEAGSWLTRFKELDLRLVHWKMFLPQKWKDSNMSRDTAFVNMDPNLTLAHITHNTSMILLHQHIAYPPPEWSEFIRLPSSCSAGTCQSAAVETASITEKYLVHMKLGILHSQFALCAFVAARILLVHWRYYGGELQSEFFSLVDSLESMSVRWVGEVKPLEGEPNPLKLDLAGKYAIHLKALHQQCVNSPQFRMDANFGRLLPPLAIPAPPFSSPVVTPAQSSDMSPAQQRQKLHKARTQSIRSPSGYSNPASYSPSAIQGTAPNQPSSQSPSAYPPQQSHNPSTVQAIAPNRPSSASPSAYPPQHPQNYPHPPQYNSAYFSGSPTSDPNLNGRLGSNDTGMIPLSQNYSNEHGNIDELTAMSDFLLGQQFSEMDRVITLDETDFALGYNMWGHS